MFLTQNDKTEGYSQVFPHLKLEGKTALLFIACLDIREANFGPFDWLWPIEWKYT